VRGCLSSDEVARYVDPAASTDRGELADHVDGCEPCRQVVAAAVRAARSVTRPAASPDDAHPGDHVERYAMFEPLGVGGMGVVYRAYDPRLERAIAIKLLRRGLCDENNRTRMSREAKMLAKLAHPNVVAVHDAGAWHDRVFIAMELVDGVTLRDWLTEAPRTWREIVDVLVQAGEGLASAHAAGLVHRDFKPQNVLIGRDGRARVSDFGLAEVGAAARSLAVGAGDSTEDSLTATGAVLGTPGYMAPEQRAGDAVDAAADQYSFCVTAYEALLGERPIAGASMPPGKRVPRRISRCVARGLAKSPADRFPSMRALVDELRLARGRSHRVLASAVVMGCLLAGGGVLYARSTGGPSAEDRCTAAAAEASALLWNAQRRDTLARAFAGGAAYTHDIGVAAATRLTAYANTWRAQYVDACRATRVSGTQTEPMLALRMTCLDEKRRQYDALLDEIARLDATKLGAVPDAIGGLADATECSNLAALASRSPQPQSGPLATEYDELVDALAEINVKRDLGAYQEALAKSDAVQARVDALGHKSLRAKFLYMRGELLDHAGEAAKAMPVLEDAVFASEAARDQETKIKAMVRLLMGASSRLDKEDAARWSKLAEAAIAAGPATDLERGYLLLAQGMYAYRVDDMKTAADCFERALVLSRRDPDSAQTSGLITNLASVYYVQERDAEARALWEEALALMKARYGPRHPDVGLVLTSLGLLDATLGDKPRAIARYTEALAIQEAALGSKNNRVGVTEHRIANAVAQIPERVAEAPPHYERAVQILADAYPDGHVELSEALIDYAIYLQGRGAFARALEHYERARVSEEHVRGVDDPALYLVWHGIGAAHLELAHAATAIPMLERARALRLKAPNASPQSLQRIEADLRRARREAKRA
jgi:eukaryotic-like serine/threonine-protein kinase